MKIKVPFLLLPILMFASPNIDKIKNDVSILEKNNEQINKNINRSKANTSDDVLVTENNSTELNFGIPTAPPPPPPPKPLPKDTMYFYLLQNFEKSRDTLALDSVKPTKVNSFTLNSTNNQSTQGNSNTASQNLQNNSSNEQVMNFKGFCQFDNVYDIASKMDVNIPCKIDGKIVLLNLSLVPNNQTFELFGTANFILYDKYNNGTYSTRIFIDSSLSSIKNSSNTSRNITTYYDSRKIEKLTGLAVQEVSSSLAKGTQETFQQYKDSNNKESVSYDQHGNAIVIKDTNKPDLVNNLAYATVEGVFRVLEKGVEMLQVNELPSLYQIEKGTIINVDLYSKKGDK